MGVEIRILANSNSFKVIVFYNYVSINFFLRMGRFKYAQHFYIFLCSIRSILFRIEEFRLNFCNDSYLSQKIQINHKPIITIFNESSLRLISFAQ